MLRKKMGSVLLTGMMVASLLVGCAKDAGTGSTEDVNGASSTAASTTEEVTTAEATTEEVTTEEPTTEEVTTEEPTTEEPTEESTEEETTVEVDDGVWNNQADISWIDPNAKLVAFTFDDGPVGTHETASSIRIQNALAENGMHATFFYWGNSMSPAKNEEIVRAYELGFEIGNHTWKHSDLSKLTEDEIREQIDKIDEVLKGITGQDKFLVRPPYLSVNQTVKDTVDVPLISCGLDTKDWNNATADEIIATIQKAAENGSLDGKIVLMHETYNTTAEAVEYLIPYLKEQGYQIVSVSELFKVRGKEMQAGVVYTQCK